MGPTETITIQLARSPCDESFLSKISPVLNACESAESLMIGIYLIEKNHFLYCNSKLKDILGENLDPLFSEGWDFWFSLVALEEKTSIKNRISNFLTRPYIQDKITLKYHITNCTGNSVSIIHEILLHRLEPCFLAINYFFDVSEEEKIEHCLTATKAVNKSQLPMKAILTISPREKQVLRLIADGFSSKQIADMLFISNHTVVSHRKNLIEKFQVKNTAHLIHRTSGLINL